MASVLKQISMETGSIDGTLGGGLVQVRNRRGSAGAGVIEDSGELIIANAHAVREHPRRWHAHGLWRQADKHQRDYERAGCRM